jgi:hypothetical protein
MGMRNRTSPYLHYERIGNWDVKYLARSTWQNQYTI